MLINFLDFTDIKALSFNMVNNSSFQFLSMFPLLKIISRVSSKIFSIVLPPGFITVLNSFPESSKVHSKFHSSYFPTLFPLVFLRFLHLHSSLHYHSPAPCKFLPPLPSKFVWRFPTAPTIIPVVPYRFPVQFYKVKIYFKNKSK